MGIPEREYTGRVEAIRSLQRSSPTLFCAQAAWKKTGKAYLGLGKD